MPKGPKGEKRHADTVQNAILIGRIATGEVEDTHLVKNQTASELGRKGGLKGGRARADKLTPKERAESARKAAKARWKGEK
ncbi:hypothetical protein ABIF38_001742 [Bradyrhizobium japonicum]|jgi:hypothetical protein|uniref:hypothetical protein n=1 Tax=Bradyrhizobium TaxID=374 RepID=UPI000363EBFE|nr:hypothetical protein [Bradyrhizobium elkanii]MCP1735942.1 hypothetical protein [Bradyrhizobium elkanii]MCS3571283.1 hypothetical protein [Bradyrhizobium elkanii]MCS3587234.1 hypothetical protein [Bradyrhizobium elkanii]MCS3625468.1 hypothetical protein [Bradyrhizobium elkanii]MCS3687478.1 hypothetical protein [Bradyrhizobium elkanii]